jgi:hypothetical protein
LIFNYKKLYFFIFCNKIFLVSLKLKKSINNAKTAKYQKKTVILSPCLRISNQFSNLNSQFPSQMPVDAPSNSNNPKAKKSSLSLISSRNRSTHDEKTRPNLFSYRLSRKCRVLVARGRNGVRGQLTRHLPQLADHQVRVQRDRRQLQHRLEHAGHAKVPDGGREDSGEDLD